MRIHRSGGGIWLAAVMFAMWPARFFAFALVIVATLGLAWMEDDPSTCSWPTITYREHYQVCGTRAQRRAQIDAMTRADCVEYNNVFPQCK